MAGRELATRDQVRGLSPSNDREARFRLCRSDLVVRQCKLPCDSAELSVILTGANLDYSSVVANSPAWYLVCVPPFDEVVQRTPSPSPSARSVMSGPDE